MTDDTSLDPWFSIVEIEVNSLCNRACDYCPVSVLPTPETPRFMSDEVFGRILASLQSIDYAGKISFHFYNEPLLRKDLHKLVRRTRDALPKAYQLLYTNGDLLTDERYDRLVAAGIDHFVVTRHSGEPIAERPRQTVQYPRDLILTNRGGILKKIAERKDPLTQPCFAPTDMLIVTSSGDVVLCCDDAQRTQRMGNVREQTLLEIWQSPAFRRARALLAQGRRGEAAEICRGCSNLEYCAPGVNVSETVVHQAAEGGRSS